MSTSKRRYQQTYEATLAGLQDSLQRHMPAGAYRNFYLWAISPQNPHQHAFLQGSGINQLVKLTLGMVEGLIDENHWPQMIAHSVPINVYQTYEIVSDNLAMGLANRHHLHRNTQRQLMRAFNKAMIYRLNNRPKTAAELLNPLLQDSGAISILDQMLNQRKHLLSINAYLQQHHNVHSNELKYTLWPVLVANIEAAAELADSTDGYLMSKIIRNGLIYRYWAVDRLLDKPRISPDESSDLGAHTILVVPSVGYYILAFGEIFCPNPRFQKLVENDVLYDMLYQSAVLLRLLNDLGTGLAMLPEAELQVFLDMLKTAYRKQGDATLKEFLLSFPDQYNLLSRIRKDIQFGEANISLHNLDEDMPVSQALAAFGENLKYFNQLYADRHFYFEELLEYVASSLGSGTISTLMLRFVMFHEKLYANHYTASVGEYAI